jgi:uncharacterized protein
VFAEYAAVLKEHFWKENDILFPMAKRLRQSADAADVLQGIATVEASIGPDTRQRYYDLARRIVESGQIQDLSGDLPKEILAAMLNTLPIELSFVDVTIAYGTSATNTRRRSSHARAGRSGARSSSAIPRRASTR